MMKQQRTFHVQIFHPKNIYLHLFVPPGAGTEFDSERDTIGFACTMEMRTLQPGPAFMIGYIQYRILE